jgi:phage terminase large subunit GpA-like protein
VTAMYDRRHFADAGELVSAAIVEALRPAPPVDLVAWTEKNIHFGPNDPFPGPYSFERFPFFKRILETLSPEHPAREVVLKKSAQIGGTILGDAFLLGWLDLVPTQLMCVHPTLPQARAWVNNKIKPAVRASTGLQAILNFDGSARDVKATELQFDRLDGRGGVIVTGANSAASLSQHTVKAQLQDDLAKWDQNDAGDPESQANSRSQAHEDAKIFKVSTPMVEGECRINRAFLAGSQEHYHVPCPQCGHLQPLEWENMQRNIDAAGGVKGAFFACVECGGVIEEKHRSWIVDPANGAKWVAHNPTAPASRPSFHLWSAYAPLMGWQRIAEAYLAAKGDQAKEQTFANDVAGLAFRRAGEAPEWEKLKARADQGEFRRARIAQGYYFVIAGADVQADRVEIGVWAFGPELRRQAVDHVVIPGKIADESTKLAVTRTLEQMTWPDPYGNARRIEHLFIDVGYEREQVLDWVRRHPPSLVTPIVGATEDNAPVLGTQETRKATLAGKRVKADRIVFRVGGGVIKSYLYGDLRKNDPLERGFVALPQGFDAGWFEQLTAERREPVRGRNGFQSYRWTLPGGRRNEVLDVAVYAYAAAERLGWKRLTDEQWTAVSIERDRPPSNPDLFSEDRSETIKPAPPPSPEAPRAPAPAPRDAGAGGGWLPEPEDWLNR